MFATLHVNMCIGPEASSDHLYCKNINYHNVYFNNFDRYNNFAATIIIHSNLRYMTYVIIRKLNK